MSEIPKMKRVFIDLGTRESEQEGQDTNRMASDSKGAAITESSSDLSKYVIVSALPNPYD